MKLTDVQTKRVKPSTKPYKVSDGGGLFLWVTPSGGKIWRWTYRHEGRAKLMSFGSYPDVSLSLARELHIEARKLLASGMDPMARRKADKAAAENSFQSVSLRWLEHWRYGKSPRHVDYVKRRMDADILPCLGTRAGYIVRLKAILQGGYAITRWSDGMRSIAEKWFKRRSGEGTFGGMMPCMQTYVFDYKYT